MATRRSFSTGDVPAKSDDYFGGGVFARVPQSIADAGVKSMNLELTLEEGLKLSLALTSCLQQINRYNRNTSEGRRRCVLLSIKIDGRAISVIETSLPASALDAK